MTTFARLCAEHKTTPDDIRGPRRERALMAKRREIALRLRSAGLSLPQIGRLMKRHHATIINLLRPKSERRAQND